MIKIPGCEINNCILFKGTVSKVCPRINLKDVPGRKTNLIIRGQCHKFDNGPDN